MMLLVRWWTKTLLWAGILLACAAAGAFVADRWPDLLVRDVPHSGPPDGSSPGPETAEPTRWTLHLTSRTTHRFRVGGSCTSDWRMRAQIRVSEEGRVRGRGTARLRPGAGCDFPSAQVQADRVRVQIVGNRDGGVLRVGFLGKEVRPAGSQDLGAFVMLLPKLRVTLEERAGAEVSRPSRLEDPEDEFYAAVTLVRLIG
jgi:hypothetical protein